MRGAMVAVAAVALVATTLTAEVLVTNVMGLVGSLLIVIALTGLLLLAVHNWIDGHK